MPHSAAPDLSLHCLLRSACPILRVITVFNCGGMKHIHQKRWMLHVCCNVLAIKLRTQSALEEQQGQDGPVKLTWLPDKFQVNWPFGSREEVQYRFSRWRPSWISNQNDFSYFWSTLHLNTANEVSSQMAFWFRIKKFKIDFSHGCQSNLLQVLTWDFIHVHLICKFQEHTIKTEWVTPMTKSNRGIFSNQGDVTKINDLICPVFKLGWHFIHVHLICKFQDIWSKLKELRWWQTFSNCKSMEPCSCHSNQGFHWIFMKSLCHQCHTI